VAIRNDYKGIYSPMTLYEIEIKEKEIGRRREREKNRQIILKPKDIIPRPARTI
jgi:hypothetical protein